MNSFSEFQFKLNELNRKIEAKKIFINEIFNSNIDTINEYYNEANLIKHINLINLHREKFITVLLNVLSNEMSDFNGLSNFLVNNINQESNFNLRKFKISLLMVQIKEKDIKDNFLYFNKSQIKEINNNLNKTRFTKAFSLSNISKYSVFLMSKKRFGLYDLIQNIFGIVDLDDSFASKFFSLPQNNIFICTNSSGRIVNKMMILNRDGLVLFSRQLQKKYINEEFKICSTYILRMYHEFKGRCCILNIEVYDFKLNLVKKFELDESYSDDVVINKNEFALESIESKNVLVFNSRTLKSIILNLQDQNECEKFYIYNRDTRLIHLNETKLYYIKYGCMIYILDRRTGVRLRSNVPTNIKDRFNLKLIKFDSESRVYLINNDENSIRVYQSDGTFLYNFQLSFNSKWFYFTQFDTVVFNMKFVKQNETLTIEFDEF